MSGLKHALMTGFVFLLSATSACTDETVLVPARFQLKVSLFPWVPEAESLLHWIEQDFEAKHHEIDLVLRPLKKSYDWEPEYAGDLSYEIDKASNALTQDGTDSQHIVEIDTIILGALRDKGAVSPFHLQGPDYLRVASEAVTLSGTEYGVPHWTCGYFVISEADSIRTASSIDELLGELTDLGTDRPDVMGDLDGSWTSIMVYLDTYRDTYPNVPLRDAVAHTTLESAVLTSLAKLGRACSAGGSNHCDSDGVETFVNGNVDALIGYSERLNPILSSTGWELGDLHVASAPFGDGDHPTLFTDALVLSPTCVSARCKDAARAFAAYYVSDEVFEVLLMGLDMPNNPIPRYLLPSTESAFNIGRVVKDRLYNELREEIQDARPYPNVGAPKARETGAIRNGVKTALGL